MWPLGKQRKKKSGLGLLAEHQLQLYTITTIVRAKIYCQVNKILHVMIAKKKKKTEEVGDANLQLHKQDILRKQRANETTLSANSN